MSSSSIALSAMFALLALLSFGIFVVLHMLLNLTKQKKFVLIQDLIFITKVSAFFLCCRCSLLVARVSKPSLTELPIISILYIVSILGIVLTITIGVSLYCLLLVALSNATSLLTDAKRAQMRKHALFMAISFASLTCLAVGAPYTLGLKALSHVMVGLFSLIMLSFLGVANSHIHRAFRGSSSRGWRLQPIQELKKSLLGVTLSVVMLLVCTIVYVASYYVGHMQSQNRNLIRYGLGISSLFECVACNMFQLAIIYAMRSPARKTSVVDDAQQGPSLSPRISDLPRRVSVAQVSFVAYRRQQTTAD